MDTLSNTWSKVKTFAPAGPLAQQVVKQGLAQGKKLAKDAAGKGRADGSLEYYNYTR